jgi:hypothetical protein
MVLIVSISCSIAGPTEDRHSAETISAISPIDIEAHVRVLTDDRTEGRRAGTSGEGVASEYIVRVMREIGLEPAGTDSGYLHPFDFTAGVALGPHNELTLSTTGSTGSTGVTNTESVIDLPLEVDTDWRPLAFSTSGEIPASPIVFAGYGLIAPALGQGESHDDYADLDIADRWVMVFRDLPTSLDGARRQYLQRYASLRFKAMAARDHGARGILLVSGPLGEFRNELVPLRFDASLAGTRIAVVSISDALARRILAGTNVDLEDMQRSADETQFPPAHFEIENLEIAARIDLETLHAQGHNVLGRLQVGLEPSRELIVLGAHFDHLGHGEGSASLASGQEVGAIHPGADDNASGVAVLLEIAAQLTRQVKRGVELGERDFVFAAWSGEELGLLGSARWVTDYVDPHSQSGRVVAYLNFDMVGRLRESLIVQGLGSSPGWTSLVESAANSLEISISPQQDSYLPTDAMSFYTEGIPALSTFTGVHSEYHTPRDTIDRLNLVGAAKVAELGSRVAQALSRATETLEFQAQTAPAAGRTRSSFRVFLGTVPDYAQTDVKGVRLTGVAPAGPAGNAGLRGGDVIVEVDGTPIENLYDYTYALDALRIGKPARIVVLRDTERIPFEVVPSSRD